MTYKFQLIGMIAVTALSACSSLEEREIASGSFEYIKEQPGQKIAIPNELDQPNFSDSYKLPEIGENAPVTAMGKDLSVLSPSLVLPIVAGSHIEEGSKSATVWFDQVDDSVPLDTSVWNSLIRFLETEGIGVETFDKDKQRLVTDWMVWDESKDNKWYSWSKSERTIKQRFEFSLDKKIHGRSAALSADLVEYKEQLNPESPEITQSKDERRNEIDVLNKVVKHYEFETQLASVKRYRQIREGLPMELGFDSDGEPAFVVDADYEITWPRLLLVLRKLGFDVKDFDKSNGLMFVKYNGSEEGWWSDIWSSDKNQFDLDTEEYRIKVVAAGEKTSITLLDDESKPFLVNKLTDLYPKFSKTMSADNLDI
ncbi:outer membrane protein assembly factor BamC [Paraglaciecola arctica]|uniref:outer membrane protein assembly factor BamC n=1 Tax=Paraglaciecola arctica TaxID=1128911 RepID=UPI001C0791BC|nr:outer membrane protein assembly factor BamC [Paraglaciecola arctica]MBU3005217.1 outer membrane protein assembly factor BamC [Paraglaciecola arctica]